MITRAAAIAATVALLVAATACAGPGSSDAARSRLGDDTATELPGAGKKPKKVLNKGAKVGKKAGAPGSKSTDPDDSKAVGAAPEAGTASGINPALATRSASVTDPPDDAQKEGVTPAYAEVLRASITGLGEDFRMALTVGGDAPDRMPNDKTHWIVAFGITGPEEDEGYSFGAQATEKGWRAYAGGKEGSGRFPGTFVIEGNEIHMTVPWTYIQGPRRFKWYSASNWFSQLANTTHYAVDLAPSEGLAKFPN